jgi:hypothetical protein
MKKHWILISKARLANPEDRQQNVGDQKQVLHMGFKAKHESQLEKMRFGFKVPVRFIPLSNAWLWVRSEPYPKSVNVRWISNLISNKPIFYTLLKFPSCLKIYCSSR